MIVAAPLPDAAKGTPFRPRIHAVATYFKTFRALSNERLRAAFGYKDHVSIDRRFGFIRGWSATGASAYDGAQLSSVLNRSNTGSKVWADTAYRSIKNEEWREENGYVSDIHRKKPKGRPMSQRT